MSVIIVDAFQLRPLKTIEINRYKMRAIKVDLVLSLLLLVSYASARQQEFGETSSLNGISQAMTYKWRIKGRNIWLSLSLSLSLPLPLRCHRFGMSRAAREREKIRREKKKFDATSVMSVMQSSRKKKKGKKRKEEIYIKSHYFRYGKFPLLMRPLRT